jgi:hypothetical protein
MKNEIVLYQSNQLTSKIEVRIEDDTVWLNRQQISVLFGRDIKTIGKHINNVFAEGELSKESTVANFATVQIEGSRTVERIIEYYNLDVIISVGYRVKSQQGTQFRIWANKVLKDYLLKGYALNRRMSRLEDSVEDLTKKVSTIEMQINSNLLPDRGVFFDGQVFDSFEFIAKIIKSAQSGIILIDNYIDENTLSILSHKKRNVEALILTKKIDDFVKLGIEKANKQYGNISIKTFNKSHDRFLIVDLKEVYHIGASIKDLGKKWFAFSKMDKKSVGYIIDAINVQTEKSLIN